MSAELTETTAIVTGATGGMGRAITAALAAAGADVIATDLNDAGADALLAAAPGSVHFVAGDVSIADDVAAVVATALSRTGRLDLEGLEPGQWRIVPREEAEAKLFTH